MGVDLHLRLPVLRLGQVLFQLDADELPLIRLLGDLGRRDVLEDLFNVRIFLCGVAALRPHDRVTTVLFELEAQVELLALLGTVAGVHQRLLLLVELLQVHHAQPLQMLIFLHLTAVTAVDFPPDWRGVPFEAVGADLGFLVSELNGLSYFFLALGEDGRFGEGYLHLIGLARVGALGGVGLGVVARPLVLLLGLALEEIEGFVHAGKKDYKYE